MRSVGFVPFLIVLLVGVPSTFAQDIVIDDNDTTYTMSLRNDRGFDHGYDANLLISGSTFAPFMVASGEGTTETGGVFGNNDIITLWSPGDYAYTPSSPPSALVYILDEDYWSDNDGDPYNNGALKAYINNAGVWQTSDERRKARIKRYTGSLDRVRALNAYTYVFKRTDEEAAKAEGREPERRVGLLAQEVAAVVPEAVASNGDGELFLNYALLTPVLLEAIKEQQAQIEALRAEIGPLRHRLAELESAEQGSTRMASVLETGK